MSPHRIFAYAAPLIVFAAVFFGAVMLDDDHDCEAKTCPDCGGDGEVTCSSCGGQGEVEASDGVWEGCTSCGGSGNDFDENIVYGSGTVTCSTCGGSGTVADPHTHSYSKTGSKYYTCGGWVYTYTCSCGDSYTTGSGYSSHNYVSDGGHWSGCKYYTDKKCSRCGDTTSTYSYTSHSWGSWTTTKAATCTSSGTQTRTCSDCGNTETQTISATGHSYVSHSAVSPTCTKSGNDAYYTCSKCSTIFNSSKAVISSIPTKAALGHSWGSWTVTKEATCTDSGTQKHTCSRCSSSETKTISATGHSYVSHSAVSPTCTKSGNDAYYTCSKCSTIFNSSKSIISSIPTKAALGHSWGSWTVTKAATCTDSGTQKHTCSRCSASETKTISALGHQWYVTAYDWSEDCSECEVYIYCARSNAHTSLVTADSTNRTVKDSEVRFTTTYSISGTDSSSGLSYSDTEIRYTHRAVLKYSASGASDVPLATAATYVSEDSSPSGSASITVGSAPSISGKIFGAWSDGKSDHRVSSKISVPYGSVVTLTAVWEDPLSFTTVPTASCVVTPVIDYSDDGSYTLQSQSVASYTLGSSMAASSDVWTDPNYRTPPEADNVINITDDLTFKSSDPAYTIRWDLNDSSGADSDKASMLSSYLGMCKEWTGSKYHQGYSYTVDSCLPSWITWDAGLKNDDLGQSWYELVIRPALQQVSKDTHGDYWIYYECTYPKGIFATPTTITFLVKFSVDVSWSGGVIVPDKSSTFVLRLDYGFNSGANNKTLRQICSADASEYRFNLIGTELTRDGFTFKGWATTSGSGYTDIGEEYPLNIGSASVQKSVDDKGNPVYTATIYAVWEEIEKEDPVIPDDLRDLLGLLQDPYVLGLFVLICFLVAVIVRVRRQGMI